MKKQLVILMFIGILFSCSKETKNIELNVTELTVEIRNDETYIYDLGEFPDEVGASIKSQPKNYKISKLKRESTGETIYTYKPKDGFVGIDIVEFSVGGFNVVSGKSEEYSITRVYIEVTK